MVSKFFEKNIVSLENGCDVSNISAIIQIVDPHFYNKFLCFQIEECCVKISTLNPYFEKNDLKVSEK